MRINVIDGGDNALNAMLYPPPDERLLNYFQDNLARAVDTFTGISDSFVSNVSAMYDQFNNSALLNATKALIHGTGGHVNQDVVYPVEMYQMGEANLAMQQYIIANPVVNKLYNDNMCNGFEDTYYDYEPGVTGKERYDYQRVMDGVVQFEDDNDDAFIMHYSNDDYVESPLNAMDKFAILETWQNVEMLIYQDIDPTDPDMGDL